MRNLETCKWYESEEHPGYVVEYRGDFKTQIDNVDYACGDIITDNLAVVVVRPSDIKKLRVDVPSIIFIENRNPIVLQDITPSELDSINKVKINPYLQLTGRGVLIGIVDTGIDYLNREFIREDGTSRILSIWDQGLYRNSDSKMYIGNVYDNDLINKAIEAKNKNGNPYEIVPSIDEEGHGTKMAGIIGARGVDKGVKGIASDSDFVIVKMAPSENYRKMLVDNNLPITPVYNNSELIAGLEYLNDYARNANRPIVIFIGVGNTQGAHNGNNLTSKYLTSLGSRRGQVLVSGTGNEGDAATHFRGHIKNVGDIEKAEFIIPREMKSFMFSIWVQAPNKVSINVVSPTGESTGNIKPNIVVDRKYKFLLDNTSLELRILDPEEYTGEEQIFLNFSDIKAGVWRLEIKGDYLVSGRYDIWFYPKKILPEGVRFLVPDEKNTLTIPSTALRVVTVAFYDSEKGVVVSESGKGFNPDGNINPDIAAPGINIITTSPGEKVTKVSGSSPATAIVAGMCALILQWAIVDRNDIRMYSSKVRSFLIYGAIRREVESYPNERTGYGFVNLDNVFDTIAGIYRSDGNSNVIEMKIGDVFIRMDKEMYRKAIKKGDIFE